MPRRSADKTLFDEVIETFGQLPGRVGLITALVLILFGWLLPLVFTGPGLTSAFATTGRFVLWVLAALVMIGAAVGAMRRSQDRRRFDSTATLEDLTWSQFEGYLAEYFRRRGSSVTYRGGAVADGGVDLVLDDAAGRRIVQAKHWKVRSVGVVPLRALWGILDDERAQGAVVVTSGQFTADALAFAEGKRLELIGGEQLRRLVAEVRAASGAEPVPAASQTVACPQCGRGALTKRLARHGRNAGSSFLGCSRFPDCRYTRSA
jgi:restriction system protein